MKWSKWLCFFLFAFVAVQGVWASERSRPYQINNRLRVEYDDNIYQAENDKETSLKIIEELEFLVNFNLQNTYVGIRYRPSYVWWDNRPSDSTDLQHEFDFILNHAFTPRLTLSAVDTLRRGESPKLENDGALVRDNTDFYYNTFNATLGYLLRPATRIEFAGRYIAQIYDEDNIADSEDIDLYVAGLTLRHQLVPETTLFGDLRAESVEYKGPDRGSKSLYAGGGIEQIFSPGLIGSLKGGYQRKDFNSEDISSESQPYVDVVTTFLPSPATRLSGGVGYSMFEAEAFPFASQNRTRMYLSLAHDFTARLSLYLTGSYTMGHYEQDQAIQEPDPENPLVYAKGGDEDITEVSARAAYQLTRSNWLELGWQYVDFVSDLEYSTGGKLRQSFVENRVDVGWKTQF